MVDQQFDEFKDWFIAMNKYDGFTLIETALVPSLGGTAEHLQMLWFEFFWLHCVKGIKSVNQQFVPLFCSDTVYSSDESLHNNVGALTLFDCIKPWDY